MMYNIKCPQCGAQQTGLNLKETGGTFICSHCENLIKIDLGELEKKQGDI